MAEDVRAKIRVSGVVQGVGYRYFVRRTAEALGVAGFVKNRFDGVVEVVAEGEKSAVIALIDDLGVGPRYASVERVDVEWEKATGEFRGFTYAF
ncbi:MAG TPA: acylphosphatase [bacterium]|nr:acylphosphatase [bacterium]